MLFPYNTDAPIYHFPYCTIGLIAINTFLFFGTMFGIATPEQFEEVKWLCLEFDCINPLQWLTNNFMHADLIHLGGNMVFLWAFGLVVEGKLGWRRYLTAYLAMGIVYGALIQLVMFGLFSSPECALGASGVIYSIMGMAVIWAPKNEMHCFLWMGAFSRTLELPVLGLCGFYFGMQVLFFWLGGYQMSSEALHLTGLAIGLPMGVWMLKRNLVDCEGWDLFNVWQGTEQEAARLALEKRRGRSADEVDEPRLTVEQQRTEARTLLRRAIDEKQSAIVAALFRKHQSLLDGGRVLSPQELIAVVSALHAHRQWVESIPLMRLAIERVPQRAAALRLTLAQILVQKEQRPRQALAVLNELPAKLPEDQAQRRAQIQAAAQRQIQQGALEVDLEPG